MTSGGTRHFAGSVRGFEVPPARVVIHVIPLSTAQPNEPSARSLIDWSVSPEAAAPDQGCHLSARLRRRIPASRLHEKR